jgi:uracil-DNA glycosylase
VVLALGLVGHQAVLKLAGRKQKDFKFAHGAQHDLGDFFLFDSYHVSRYNTSTGRLTEAMFDSVLKSIHDFLKA